MLKLRIPDLELFDNDTQEFVVVKGGAFVFEHSLLSISKWEEKHEKPFLVTERKTKDEIIDYYYFMAIKPKPDIRLLESPEVQKRLNEYMQQRHTATVVNSRSPVTASSFTTSETVYAMMAMTQVPFECEKWNFNRLLMLLQVIGEKSKPQEKMSQSEILAQNADLNAKRRRELNSKG